MRRHPRASRIDVDRKFGVFLGLLAAARRSPPAATWRCRRRAPRFGDAADRLSGGGAAHQPPSRRRHRRRHRRPPAAGAAPPPPPPPSSSRASVPPQEYQPPCSAPPPPPAGPRRRSGSAGVALREAGGDPLGEGDDRHHRVDADRGREQAGVGDVEALDAADRAVGVADALRGSAAIRAVPIGWNASRRRSEGFSGSPRRRRARRARGRRPARRSDRPRSRRPRSGSRRRGRCRSEAAARPRRSAGS